MDDVEVLRAGVRKLNFHVKELPIRRGQDILRWRLIASRGEKSFTVEANNLLAAFQNLGLLLGLRKPGVEV